MPKKTLKAIQRPGKKDILVELLRSNSTGIKATYGNIEHHAPTYLNIVKFLENDLKNLWEPDKWKQGSNVHVFESKGRKFVLRNYKEDDDYKGISFSSQVQGEEILIKLPITGKEKVVRSKGVYLKVPSKWKKFSRYIEATFNSQA